MSKTFRKTALMCLVSSLVFAVAAGPATAAHRAGSERKQSSAIKKNAKNGKKLKRSLGRTDEAVRGLRALVGALQGDVKATQDFVPLVVQALTGLQDGLTTVGARLTTLGSAYGSVEYGAVGVFITPPSGSGQPESRYGTASTSDIPDDGNVAVQQATIPISVVPSGASSAAGTFAPGSKVEIKAAIRSAESDGATLDGDPAGQVGGIMSLKCAAFAGCAIPGAGTAPAGAIICTVGPTTTSEFQTPAGPQRLRVVEVPLASARTDSSQPDFDESDKTVDPLQGSTATGTGGSGPSADGSCTLPGPGVYEISANIQFADIPTSANPGPTD